MKRVLLILGCILYSHFSFSQKRVTNLTSSSIIGTWKLVSSKKITNKDTVTTYPVKGQNQEMLKMFNGTHFSFFKHDLHKGKTKSPIFDSGSGTYALSGNQYSEHLIYCNYRDWEGTKFKFTLTLENNKLTQKGIERIAHLNVDQEIIEVYVKIK